MLRGPPPCRMSTSFFRNRFRPLWASNVFARIAGGIDQHPCALANRREIPPQTPQRAQPIIGYSSTKNIDISIHLSTYCGILFHVMLFEWDFLLIGNKMKAIIAEHGARR